LVLRIPSRTDTELEALLSKYFFRDAFLHIHIQIPIPIFWLSN